MFIRLLLFSTFFISTLCDSFSVKPELIEALMIESLKHNLVQACDSEKITLHCPRNTHILIENVFYGRLVPSTDLCPISSSSSAAGISSINEDTTCVVSQANSKITELCRNKRKCRIIVKSNFFENDPCPSTSKYLQISYKCKPISFEDQNFCEGSQMQLSCKQNKRLSIYSANYGRIANGQMMQCPNHPKFIDSQPVYQDCVADVLPQVLQKCHAQTDCTIDVDDKFLGSPCPHAVRKYLSLIFMCVNDEVFSEAAIKGNLESLKELEREIQSHQQQSHFDDKKPMAKDQPSVFRPTSMRIDHSNENFENVGISNDASAASSSAFIPEIEAVPGYATDSEHQIKIYSAREHDLDGIDGFSSNDGNEQLPNAVGFANDLMTLGNYIKNNKEKAILYFLLSVTTGLLLMLLVCICQQCRKKPKTRQSDNRRMQAAKSPELNSLIGGSSNTSPMFFDSDTHSRMGLDMGDGHYMRFSQVTPPRIPQSMHYYT